MTRTILCIAALAYLIPLEPAGAVPDPERRTPVVIAVEKTGPAVVNISTKKIVEESVHPFFREWYGRYKVRRPGQSVGSGVIIHPDGYLVTNRHVVHMATEIVVSRDVAGEEKTYKGTLLAEDPDNDLALLKIWGAGDFPHVPIGNSGDLMIGEPVIALGNPFGVGKTVTTGVVSALGRSVRMENGAVLKDFIQTDAAINPGNSGGALLNIHGELIGVNTAIIRGGEGLGFAISAERVKAILARLINEAVRRANLGFRPVADGIGVLVRTIEKQGAAEKAGLRVGDRIERVDNESIRSIYGLATPLLMKKPGDSITFKVLRARDRKDITLTVPMSAEAQYVALRMGFLGRDLPAEQRTRGLTGVIVTEVLDDGPAARVKMRPGDLILTAARSQVSDLEALAALLKRVRSGTTMDVEVVRSEDGRAKKLAGSVTVR